MRSGIVAAALLSALPALAADDADEVAAGAALFHRYCAGCHGPSARGDGPMSASLSSSPNDLTGLAAENAGAFPLRRVVLRIDGREVVAGHGEPMPAYGAFFDGADRVTIATDAGPLEVSPPVLAVARFIESLQTP